MENSTQNNPQARSEIPDLWGQNGHCPVCGAKPLYVRHINSGPDFLLCQKCELSFEVAQSGGNVRVKNIPEDLGFAEERLRYKWVTPQLLKNLVEERDTRKRALAQETITPPRKQTWPILKYGSERSPCIKLAIHPKKSNIFCSRQALPHAKPSYHSKNWKKKSQPKPNNKAQNCSGWETGCWSSLRLFSPEFSVFKARFPPGSKPGPPERSQQIPPSSQFVMW